MILLWCTIQGHANKKHFLQTTRTGKMFINFVGGKGRKRNPHFLESRLKFLFISYLRGEFWREFILAKILASGVARIQVDSCHLENVYYSVHTLNKEDSWDSHTLEEILSPLMYFFLFGREPNSTKFPWKKRPKFHFSSSANNIVSL